MRRVVWVGFGVFCLLSSAAWLIPTGMRGGLPSLEREGLVFTAAGLGALILRGHGLGSRMLRVRSARVMGMGIALFGVPAVLIEWAGRSVPAVSISAAFALIPAAVVLVTVSSASGGDEEEGRRLLAPALAAFGGVLLLLPVDLPGSIRGRLMLGVVCLGVGVIAVSGVWLHRLLRGLDIGDAVVLVGFGNGLFLLGWCLAGRSMVWSGLGSMVSVSSLIELLEMLLLVWLLREMSPVRLAARYLVIPLLTVIEGYLVLRPELTARMGLGAALLAAGAGWILFSRESEDQVTLSLR